MPRINHVKSARKAQGTCRRCGKVIEVDTPYKWFKKAYRPKQAYHAACRIRPSELSGAKYAAIYDAIEDAQDSIAGLDNKDDIVQAVNDVADECESVREEYEESLNNMPEPLQEGDTGQQIQEYIDEIQEFEEACRDFDGSDFDDEDDDKDDDEDDQDEPTWLQDLRDAAIDVLGGFGL